MMPHKILNVLPSSYDHAELALLDPREYEVHFLYAKEDVVEKEMSWFTYGAYLAKPDFLTSYVDRAVRYVEEHDITAVFFSQCIASVVASVICERTGLPGPSLDATFLCLHKYYSRKIENKGDSGKLWFDYIDLDQPSSEWKAKIRYPCFLKAPILCGSAGHSYVNNEAELELAVANLSRFLAPFFTGYCEFFRRYLDLDKYPLAVQNIAVVEEIVISNEQYSIDGMMDDEGNFELFTSGFCQISPNIPGRLQHWIVPECISADQETFNKIVAYTSDMAHRFGITNTFFSIEFWQQGNDFILIEFNCRISYACSKAYRKMWGVSAYDAGIFLACGQKEKLAKCKTATERYKEGEPISGIFYLYTSGEGKGEDFINYEYARAGSLKDGVYHGSGLGVHVAVLEKSAVRPRTTVGARLGDFSLTANSSSSLLKRANEVRAKLLLRKEDQEIMKLPGTT